MKIHNPLTWMFKTYAILGCDLKTSTYHTNFLNF